MKESYYFPHDYNATQDPKMMFLLSKCGLSGIGLYWILIEILHQEPNGKITKTAYDGYLKLYCTFDDDRGQQVFNTCQQMLIKSELLVEQDGFVTSLRVLKNKHNRFELSKKRSEAGKISANSRLSTQPTSVQQVSTSVQQGKERKGKEIKGKEKKLYMDCVYLTDEECLEFKKLFNDSGCLERIKNLNDYIMSKGKKYKSHYHTILTWERKNNGQIGRSKQTAIGEEKKPSKYANIECETINTDDPGTTEKV